MSKTVKITLVFEGRDDGGLRLWSPELPGLVLSDPNPITLVADISPVLDVLLLNPDEGFLKNLWYKEF